MGSAPSEDSYQAETIKTPKTTSSLNDQSNKREISDDDIKNINKNVLKVQKMITKAIDQINAKDVKINLLIGTTGSGKSTLTYLLKGGKAKITKYHGNYVLECSDKVFHGMKSGTALPQIEIDNESGIIYCDCPGFLDTNGFLKEIENSFTFDKLLEKIPNKNLKVKILIVEQISTFDFRRGAQIRKEIKRIQKMFSANKNAKFFENIGFVVSKFVKGSNIDINEKIVSTLNIQFNENHIFIFPAPTSTSGEYNDFDQKEKLLQFIYDEETFILNPKHQITLDEGTNQFVQKIKSAQLSLIQDKVDKFFSSVKYKSTISSPEEISSCIRTLNKIGSQEFNDAVTFVKIIRQNEIAYFDNQSLKEIEESQILTDFIAKLLTIDINKEIKNVILMQIEKAIIYLKHERNQKETIENERQNAYNTLLYSTVNQVATAAVPLVIAGVGYAASKIPKIRESSAGSNFIQSCYEPIRAQAAQNPYINYQNSYDSYQNQNQYTYNSYQMLLDRNNNSSQTDTPFSLI